LEPDTDLPENGKPKGPNEAGPARAVPSLAGQTTIDECIAPAEAEDTGPGPCSEVVFDCETTGLDPWVDHLTWVGFQADDREPVCLRHPDDHEQIQQWLSLDATYIDHNSSFDLRFLEHSGYTPPDPQRVADTIVLAYVAAPQRRQGDVALPALQKKLVATGELPASILEPEIAIKQWMKDARKAARKGKKRLPQKGDAPAEILVPYLKADLRSTRAVWDRYIPTARNGQQPIWDLERQLTPAIYATEKRGVPVDIDVVRDLLDQSATNLEKAQEACFELADGPFPLAGQDKMEARLKDRGVDTEALARTPTGKLQIGAEAMALVDDDLARAHVAWRAVKAMDTYIKSMGAAMHGDRMYGQFKQWGAETGRMSSSGPNLQNIPKSDLRLRYAISAREGHVLVGADLDSVELRVLAAYAGAGALQDALRDGDLHQLTADKLGLTRDEGKTINYAFIYGTGAPGLAKTLKCSEAEAAALISEWFRTYPEVGRLKSRARTHVQQHRYIPSILGRHHYFPNGPNHMVLNRLVSGSCADLFKRAAVELHELDIPVVLYVHDEVVCEVEEDRADEVARVLEKVLPRSEGRVQNLSATASIHKRWSEFKQPEYSPWLEL